MLVTNSTYAGVVDTVTNMFNSKIQYQVSVVDEQNQPVPYATLWFMYAYKSAPERSVADMARLVERYAPDYDIASVDARALHSVHVYFSDIKGVYREELLENNFKGIRALPVIIGALKRGYKPIAFAKTMPVGSSHKVVLQLQKEPVEKFDPRLLELDEIRSEVGNIFPNWSGEERLAHVDRMNERLTHLAQTFEKEGKRNEAALVYYNLAYLPSVDRAIRPDGKIQIIGYTRGYDEKSPARKANLAKALSLGADIPQLRCQALIDSFVAQGGRIWNDQSKKSLRIQLISDLEACLKTANGRVFPYVFLFMSQLYSYVGNPAMACTTLQRAYSFEPSAYEASRWPKIFEDVEYRAKKPPDGLPVFPDFVCVMPSSRSSD